MDSDKNCHSGSEEANPLLLGISTLRSPAMVLVMRSAAGSSYPLVQEVWRMRPGALTLS